MLYIGKFIFGPLKNSEVICIVSFIQGYTCIGGSTVHIVLDSHCA